MNSLFKRALSLTGQMAFAAIFFVALLASLTTSAESQDLAQKDPFIPEMEAFTQEVQKNWKEKVREKEPLPKVEIGSVQYLPPEVLRASQQEFTFIKVLDELQEAATDFRVKYDEKAKKFILAFDSGRSALPAQKPAIGILNKGKIYLLDGHHKVMISLYLNAETLPIHIIDDWSELNAEEFRAKMIKMRYAYPYDKNGKDMSRFYEFDELTDNPNLYLARLLIQKVKGGIELEKFKIFKVSGAVKPLILKYNEGLPFVEYFIAQLLAENDIYYKPKWGQKVPKAVRKEIRELLRIEAAKEDSPLRDVILVDKDDELESLEPEDNDIRAQLIFEHFLTHINCETFLSPSYKVETIE